ncbi:MAG TPA: hypothetical protein PLE60_03110, partial [Candidatus Latescibacteria bacterium]|nr:hypothetical protein [Candidatus Latescibacterota bacterium]
PLCPPVFVFVFAAAGDHGGSPLRKNRRVFACAIPSPLEKILVQICNFFTKPLTRRRRFAIAGV